MAYSISVIVPVYNGEPTPPDLVRRLEPVLMVSAAEYELLHFCRSAFSSEDSP